MNKKKKLDYFNECFPGKKESFDKGEEYFDKGEDYFINGEFNEAKECFEKCVELCPNNNLYRCKLGMVLESLGKYEEAIDCFKQELNILKETNFLKIARCYYNIGCCLLKEQKYGEAIPYLEKAVSFYPNKESFNNDLECCKNKCMGNNVKQKERMNKIVEARKIFREEFEKDPDLEFGYQSNIAMLLYDRFGEMFADYDVRNNIAKEIIKLFCGELKYEVSDM